MTRYVPARHYLWYGIAALLLAGGAGWFAWNFAPISYVASGIFILTSALLFVMSSRPAVEVHEGYLSLGSRIIPWMDIRRLDRTGWIQPLIVRITLYDDTRFLLVYPGEIEDCNNLLRHLRRLSRDALLDGIPYRQYWGDVLAPGQDRKHVTPRYRILRPEDEAEVERLYQRLKTVGHLDQKNSSDEK